ncbi:MAG: cupredoxin domain-containing protein [Patescibacteria group bacterium]
MLIVAAVILLAGIAWYANTRYTPQDQAPAGEGQTNGETKEQPAATGNGTQTSPSYTPLSTKKTSITITVISPAGSDKWIINQLHTIKWSKEAGAKGSIYLVRSSDESVVGWINSEIGPHQTSYDWNTREVFTARYSPAKTNLKNGQYIIKLSFDSSEVGTVSSNVFSILYLDEVPTTVHNVTIQSYAFSPKTLTVKKGDKVVFTNNDPVNHRVVIGNLSPLTVAPGGTATLETSAFGPSPYNYYCDLHPSMTGTIVVQ